MKAVNSTLLQQRTQDNADISRDAYSLFLSFFLSFFLSCFDQSTALWNAISLPLTKNILLTFPLGLELQ
jgi:hypothetical protein